jgi:DMSO/TMAO reductase YedYZ heme-binding membrane subunit
MRSSTADCQKAIGTISILLIIVALIATIGSVDDIDDVTTFRACFGTLLAIFACAQFYVAIKLYHNRNNSRLELFQPIGLALFAIAGAVATLICFAFALPEYDVSCAIRQPIILTCISFMGELYMDIA